VDKYGGVKWWEKVGDSVSLWSVIPKTFNQLTGFLGEYEVAIDAKGRFLLPAGFRKQLPEGASAQFVINRGFEQCLTVYPMESWSRISESLAKLNDFNPKVREFKRLFLNGATIVELDSAGRINLPKALVAHAGITKDAVFTAQGDKMELWDADTYHKYLDASKAGFSDLAAEVAGGDFINPFNGL
jgi:MraZ protein